MKKLILIIVLVVITNQILFSQTDSLINNTWRLEYLIQKNIGNSRVSDNGKTKYLLYFDIFNGVSMVHYNLSVNDCYGSYYILDTNTIVFDKIRRTAVCCDNEFSELVHKYLFNDTFTYFILIDTLYLTNDKIEFVYVNNEKPVSVYNLEQNSKINVYPNPVSSKIFIKLATSIKIKQLEILNSSGQVLMSFNKDERIINLEKLLPGIYYLRIMLTSNSQIIEMLVKK